MLPLLDKALRSQEQPRRPRAISKQQSQVLGSIFHKYCELIFALQSILNEPSSYMHNRSSEISISLISIFAKIEYGFLPIDLRCLLKPFSNIQNEFSVVEQFRHLGIFLSKISKIQKLNNFPTIFSNSIISVVTKTSLKSSKERELFELTVSKSFHGGSYGL